MTGGETHEPGADEIRAIASAVCGMDGAGVVQRGRTEGSYTVSFGFKSITMLQAPDGWVCVDREVDRSGRQITWASFDVQDARYRAALCALLELEVPDVVFKRLQICSAEESMADAVIRRVYETSAGPMALHSRPGLACDECWVEAAALPTPISFRLVVEGDSVTLVDIATVPEGLF